MSLATRLLGFAACLVGGFAIGYADGLGVGQVGLDQTITEGSGNIPTLATQIIAQVNTFITQSVNPNVDTYWVVGIAFTAVGLVLLAMGDRLMPKAKPS